MTVEENHPIEVEENSGWDPRIRSIKCGEMVRSYLVKTERFLLVYDTLLGPKSAAFLRREALEFADGLPLLIVNSHADWDHYFGNMMFPEPIIGSQEMVSRVTGGVGEKELTQKRAEHPEFYDAVELRAPSISIREESTLHGGDLTIEILFTPGHRPDHLSLFIPEISTLFPGDCVEDPIPLVDEDSRPCSTTIRQLRLSLQRFVDLQPAWVLANHAAPQAGTQRVEDNLGYLQRLQELARTTNSLEMFRQEFPVDRQWDEFYQSAHDLHLRQARQQFHVETSKEWVND